MTTVITLSIILASVVVVSFFIIRNLLKQAEKLEDIQTEYENFITKQSEAIQACDKRLKEIDSETGGWYKNRPVKLEAGRAIDFALRSVQT